METTALPRTLRAQWRVGALLAWLLPPAVAWLAAGWGVRLSWRWVVAAWLGEAYVAWRVRQWLPGNRRGAGPVFADLGWGNAASWLRGALLALVAATGLTGEGLHGRGLALVAGLYACAAGLDFVDGWLARRTGRVTRLGQRLDLHLDGWGVFWAAWNAVRSGQMPTWFLAVGLARPAYVLWEAALRAAGREPGPWPPSPLRRWLAGVMMVFLVAVLAPWPGPQPTRWVGVPLSALFLAHFGLDMAFVALRSGKAAVRQAARPSADEKPGRPRAADRRG